MVTLIGLTATPYRTEYLPAGNTMGSGIETLKQVFNELLESESLGQSPRERLQAMGVLARLEIKELKTDIEIKFPPNTPEPLEDIRIEDQEQVDNQSDISPGEYHAVVVIDERPMANAERPPLNFPVIHVDAWPDNLSLRREDMYGDDGR